tara:strand:- start:55 stop:627 length:573 start_codon:yes stop_codon:yes gene_type:complete
MANSSSTGFGFKPIKQYGNNYENMGLGEYPVAASSTAFYFQDLVAQAATGYVVVGTAGIEDLIGSVNGVFYTDPTTSKPTWKNYYDGNAASDITALVNDSPLLQYEVRSNNSSASDQTDVGLTADLAYSAGVTPNFVSRATLDDSTLTTAVQQVKVIGVSRDPDNNDLTSANVVWRVILNQTFYADTTGV